MIDAFTETANCYFKTGITAYDTEPLFTGYMLVYDGKHYLIGERHKEIAPEKIKDEDYYCLTLVAIAREFQTENLTEANIIIAAGLPLTWTRGQKTEFAAYLSKNKEVNFNYKKVDYHIIIEGVRVYPQGYAAIADFASTMTGVNMVADIGNGTMNVLYMFSLPIGRLIHFSMQDNRSRKFHSIRSDNCFHGSCLLSYLRL